MIHLTDQALVKNNLVYPIRIALLDVKATFSGQKNVVISTADDTYGVYVESMSSIPAVPAAFNLTVPADLSPNSTTTALTTFSTTYSPLDEAHLKTYPSKTFDLTLNVTWL